MNLTALKQGEHGRVLSLETTDQDPASQALTRRLMELGFIPGTVITAMHRAPFLSDPLSFMARGMHVALRRHEAQQVSVELITSKEGGSL